MPPISIEAIGWYFLSAKSSDSLEVFKLLSPLWIFLELLTLEAYCWRFFLAAMSFVRYTLESSILIVFYDLVMLCW